MQGDGGATSRTTREEVPRASWSHVRRLEEDLVGATSLDDVIRTTLAALARQPQVTRVGIGITEGAGRRLRFVASEHVTAPELPWCHIDAYDDVPLTVVVRTGEDIMGSLDVLQERFPGLVERHRQEGVHALSTVPLPGLGSSVGGVIVFFDAEQHFGADQRGQLHGAARAVADAVRRVSTIARASLVDPGPDEADDPIGLHGRVELEGDPRAASAVRRFLREQLASWGIDDQTVEDAELCASELVNNVIMHAGSAFRLNVHLEDDALTVTVRDVGAGAPEAGHPHAVVPDDDALRVFGRGLTLVDALASRWGSDRAPGGTIAWFVLEPASGPLRAASTG